MSYRLKAATIAALALSATAAVTASDMSNASEASLSITTSIATTLPTEFRDTVSVPKAGEKPAQPTGIVFAAPRAVVQPLASKTIPSADSDVQDEQATSLAALVDAHGGPEALEGDMRCLAGAVYFESKGESLDGQLAVARVIINRAKSGRFADTLCGVVYQRGQFSFVRGHDMPAIPTASRGWREAVAIAQIAVNDSWDSNAEGALFFHARRVSPGWGKARLAAIDNHVFYR